MNKYLSSTVGAVLMIVFAGSSALAGNPADLTSLTRVSPLYLQAMTGGENYLWAAIPVNHKTSISLFDWQSGSDRLIEVSATTNVTKNFQSGIVADEFNGNWTESLMLDLSKGNLSLGAIIPLKPNSVPQFGPRIKVGQFTTYVTLAEHSRPLYGFNYARLGYNLDIAHTDKVWWARISHAYGKFIPEVRTKLSPGKNEIAFGFAYFPG